jgi:hypothetical protein
MRLNSLKLDEPKSSNFIVKEGNFYQDKIYFILNIVVSILLFLLPFQAILVQFLIKKLGFPSFFALWKEVAVLLIVVIFIFDLSREFIGERFSFKNLKLFKKTYTYLIAVSLISLISLFNQIPLRDYILGFRFELFWVGFLAVTIDWLRLKRAGLAMIFNQKSFLIPIYLGLIGSLIICLISFIFGTENFYTSLGYGYSASSADIISAPTCHVIDYAATSQNCRLVGGFSSPNHFSAYLLLVTSFLIFQIYKAHKNLASLVVNFGCLLSCILLIYFTYSRYALIVLVVWLGIYLGYFLYIKIHKYKPIFKTFFGLIVVSPVLFLISLVSFFNADSIQNISGPVSITKPSSTTQHYRQKNIAIEIITKNPKNLLIGYGLGQSGPTAQKSYNLDSNRPIIRENYAIADKYTTFRDEVAIPENWYFQLILNGGIVYFILYMIIITQPLKGLFQEISNLGKKEIQWADIIFGLGFLGVFVGNLFLHIWENQAVSIYFVLVYIYYQLNKNSS